MDVVVVELPNKVKTINKYLGQNYKVMASFGHVRDLPAKDGSVLSGRRFRHVLGSRRAFLQAAGRYRQGGQGSRRPDSGDRPRPRGRSDFLACAGSAAAEARSSRTSRSAASSSIPSPSRPCSMPWPIRARSIRRWSTPISPAARSTIWSASRCRRFCGASCPAPARPDGCSRWRCASSATARPRSNVSSAQEYWLIAAILGTPRDQTFEARLTGARRQEARQAGHQDPTAGERHQGDAGRRRLQGAVRRGKADQAQPRPALHHVDAAAGGVFAGSASPPSAPCRSRSASMKAWTSAARPPA